jgi:hypothetical protein
MPWMEQAKQLLRKAHDDAYALNRLVGDPSIVEAIVGFHAQQACEKGLKAVLASHGVPYPKTHNLRVLRDLLFDAGLPILTGVDDSLILSPYAAQFRHDDPPEGGFDRAEAVCLVADVLAWCDAQVASSRDES